MTNETFDYIVVGAGSAGAAVANRLSADPRNRVLLLEAGGRDNWIWFHIPVGYLFAIGNPRADWMFRTEAEPGLNGRSLAYPRGRVIGGSSAISAGHRRSSPRRRVRPNGCDERAARVSYELRRNRALEKDVYLGLDGRAALVTAGARGAGRAIAIWLARAGCDVAIVDVDGAAAESLAEELRGHDYTAIAVAAEPRSESDVEAMVASVVEQFDALDVAVNDVAWRARPRGRRARGPSCPRPRTGSRPSARPRSCTPGVARS